MAPGDGDRALAALPVERSEGKSCPSAPCVEGALLVGVKTESGRLAYVQPPTRVDAAFVERARAKGRPEARFRFSLPCSESGCPQWTGTGCGVVDHVLADLAEVGEDPARQVAMAATKAWRYVPEMREIARAQSAAGQGDRLFEAIAEVFERLATTALAGQDPEQVPRHPDPHEVISKLL
jgi:hypothetical protein